MSHAAHIAIGASNRIMAGGLLVGGIVDAVADSVAMHRAERAIASGHLADRLAIVRAAEQEALRTARDLATELARTRRELADAKAALAQEQAYSQRVTAALRQAGAR
jgi:hypothetical protein